MIALAHARSTSFLKTLPQILLALVLYTGSETRANLIVNGDFSAGNTGFSSEYTYVTNFLDAGNYSVVPNPRPLHFSSASYGDHTTGSGLMMAVNGSYPDSLLVWSQTVPVQANALYEFSAWASSWTLDPFALLDLRINDVSIGQFEAPSPTGVWTQFQTTWFSDSVEDATITIHELKRIGGGIDFALDDLAFNLVVPEPVSLFSCILLVGMATHRASRRRG